MRILQIINSLGTGGAEKLLLDTIPLYRKAGIEMDVLVFWNNNHQFINALKSLGCCKVFVLKESENYKDIYNPFNILRLKTYLKQYDIAHVHLFPAQYYAMFANLLNGNSCKLVFTEHNTSNRRFKNPIFKSLERYVYSKYQKVVCISDEIKSIYENYLGIALKDRFVLINNGVNLSVIKEASALVKEQLSLGISEDKFLLAQVSAFRPQKDQATLIKAMFLLSEEIQLVLIGDGETRTECEKLVINLGLEERVFFLGQRMDIPQILKTADIVVLSSFYEGMSLSSIEGLASGRPFVASDVPGLSEIVKGAGVLFEQGNEEDLADKINELLQHRIFYGKIVQSCQERAAQYDIDIMINKHIELYRNVYEA